MKGAVVIMTTEKLYDTVKSLQDGGTYIVRFKESVKREDAEEWMKFLHLTLLGRNIRLLPEFPHFFEIVGEPT